MENCLTESFSVLTQKSLLKELEEEAVVKWKMENGKWKIV